MEKRNLTPLRNVLVRYLVVCGGGSIVILLVWWGLFMSLIRNGFLLPPVTLSLIHISEPTRPY